nr:histidine phosphatase family protein [Sneathiella glossodoripedis]
MEGLSYEQARLENAKAYAKFWENPVENAPPAGESFAEVCQRVGEFFNLVVRENTNDDVVFIVHAGTIRAILAQALQLEPAQSQLLDITPLSLSRITLYRHEGALSWKIDFINSTAAY